MKKESDTRKKQIAAAIVAAGMRAVVYRAAHPVGPELTARAACLEALVNDAAGSSAHRLVLERDDSLEKWDNRQLIELTRKFGCRDTLRIQPSTRQSGSAAGVTGYRMPLLGAGPKAATGAHGSRGPSAMSRGLKRLQTARTPAHQPPDGCRAHFLKLNAPGSPNRTTPVRDGDETSDFREGPEYGGDQRAACSPSLRPDLSPSGG